MKKIAIILLAALCTLSLVSCSLFDPTAADAKEFTANGLTITLTEAFSETTLDGYTAAFDSSAIAVLAIREAFTLAVGFEDYTLEEYGELVIDANGFSNIALKSADELTWFEYDYKNADNGKTYHYYSYVFKAHDAFWLVQIACLTEDMDAYADDIAAYAKSITFTK